MKYIAEREALSKWLDSRGTTPWSQEDVRREVASQFKVDLAGAIQLHNWVFQHLAKEEAKKRSTNDLPDWAYTGGQWEHRAVLFTSRDGILRYEAYARVEYGDKGRHALDVERRMLEACERALLSLPRRQRSSVAMAASSA